MTQSNVIQFPLDRINRHIREFGLAFTYIATGVRHKMVIVAESMKEAQEWADKQVADGEMANVYLYEVEDA